VSAVRATWSRIDSSAAKKDAKVANDVHWIDDRGTQADAAVI